MRKALRSLLLPLPQARNMPLSVLDLDTEQVPAAYQHKLVLCRADQHVVWRGNGGPDEPAELVARLCGR